MLAAGNQPTPERRCLTVEKSLPRAGTVDEHFVVRMPHLPWSKTRNTAMKRLSSPQTGERKKRPSPSVDLDELFSGGTFQLDKARTSTVGVQRSAGDPRGVPAAGTGDRPSRVDRQADDHCDDRARSTMTDRADPPMPLVRLRQLSPRTATLPAHMPRRRWDTTAGSAGDWSAARRGLGRWT